MIDFDIARKGLQVRLRCSYPTVYLDHWAWLEFSCSPTSAQRFVNVLKRRNGTVALSWLNLVEFCRMKDKRHGPEADSLLDSILPNVFFLDPDFGKVISREDTLMAGGGPIAPHADVGLFEHFIRTNVSSPNSLSLLTSHELYRMAQATGLQQRCDALADATAKQIAEVRQKFANDKKFQAAVNRLPPAIQIQHGTRIIWRELERSLLVNPAKKINKSDFFDFGHAVVPVAYCDYVLLDSHWRTQVEIARTRIAAAGLTFPMAQVFSAQGIERFLRELES